MGISQRSILGLMVFNIFVNYINSGTLRKFAYDSKLSDAVDTIEGRYVIQKDADELEK